MWFRELSEFWKGQAFSIQVDRIVYAGHTGLQEVLVFEAERWGTVLALDGAIQLSTLDEAAYQEVMAHTPMHLRQAGSVKRALVIGGGDGGVLRELAKYPELEEIFICEIDGGVIDTAKRFVPQTAVGFSDPRVKVHIEDGFLFLERMVAEGKLFDVIVSDLSDPIGPAESIFQGSFLELLSQVLAPDGVAALQGESYWLHADLIQKLVIDAKKVFGSVDYASIAIPTYPCGQIGALVMCKDATCVPSRLVREGGIDYDTLNYFTRDLHSAQFILPRLARERVFGKQEL
jgi:spermidine synthase